MSQNGVDDLNLLDEPRRLAHSKEDAIGKDDTHDKCVEEHRSGNADGDLSDGVPRGEEEHRRGGVEPRQVELREPFRYDAERLQTNPSRQ